MDKLFMGASLKMVYQKDLKLACDELWILDNFFDVRSLNPYIDNIRKELTKNNKGV